MKKVAVGIISRALPSGAEKEYLLVSSARDFGEYTGYFYPAGGHIEPGESEEQALVREIDEELGLSATPITLLAVTPGDIANQETYWYECTVEGEITVSDTLRDARWFTKAEIENGKVWPATREVFQKYVFNEST